MARQDGAAVGRRGFLGALGGGVAGAAAALVVAAPAARAEAESADDMRKARYRESEQVKTFYRVNGYETK